MWLAITGYLLRRDVNSLDDRVREVIALMSAGRVDEARTQAQAIPALSERVERLTSGPAWWVAAHLPGLDEPFRVARGMTAATADVGRSALPDLLSVSRALDPGALRSSGDTLRLQPLVAASPVLARAAAAIDDASRRVAGLPRSTWLGVVDGSRSRLAGQLQTVRNYVDTASRVARVLPTMLGQDGPRRYFIGLQNEAELRGTGGLPGAFAIAVADHGTLRFTRFASDTALEPDTPGNRIDTGLDFGPAFDAAYGPSHPTTSFVDSNVSPHFPYAARIWAAMWQRVSGQRVDGVMALDPTVLGYLLAATGPVELADGTRVSTQNVVALLEKDQYVMFRNTARRKAFDVAVLRAVLQRITSVPSDTFGLTQAMGIGAGQQRLLVWSADAGVERALVAGHYAGAIPDSARPFAGLVLNNAAAGKLDYYLRRELTVVRSGCGATRAVTVTVRLTNTAPASGLPRYVTARLDHPPPGAKPGDDRAIVDYYATRGASVNSVTIDGKPATVAELHDLGHPIFRFDLELPRGSTTTVVLRLQEPAGAGSPVVWRQPGVSPLDVQLQDQPCG